MKNHIAYAAFSVFLATGSVQAGPGLDLAEGLELLDIEPVEMEMVRDRSGKLMTRETFTQPDGTVVTRLTIREPGIAFAGPEHAVGALELTPGQRRLIWNMVAVSDAAGRPGEEIPSAQASPPLVREHIEAAPAPRSYQIGTRIPGASALQPLPETVTVAVPNVQDHLYAVVDQRVLLVEPGTNRIVAEVVR